MGGGAYSRADLNGEFQQVRLPGLHVLNLCADRVAALVAVDKPVVDGLRAYILRAVLEGITFEIMLNVEVLKNAGVELTGDGHTFLPYALQLVSSYTNAISESFRPSRRQYTQFPRDGKRRFF